MYQVFTLPLPKTENPAVKAVSCSAGTHYPHFMDALDADEAVRADRSWKGINAGDYPHIPSS